MKLRLKLLIILSFVIFWSCEKENSVEKKGEIYVTAYTSDGYFNEFIEGAEIFTVPPSQKGITDKFGKAILTDIDPGTYEVYAVLDDFGSGKSVVKVISDSHRKVDVLVINGLSLPNSPEIEVILPKSPANFSVNENIIFSFIVKDKDSKPSDINVVVSSDLTGYISITQPDEANIVRFETSKLLRGNHEITIIAIDKDGHTSKKSFFVSTLAPGRIDLESAVAHSNGVKLQWTKYALTDFKLYEVLRSTSSNTEGEVIATFNSIDSISYFDYAPPIATEVYYFIRVTNSVDQQRNSNVIEVIEPAGKVFYHEISDGVLHPTEPLIYIVDNVDHKLVVINYETQQEVNSISIDARVGKIAIGNNGFGLEIYVPNYQGFIKIYDAETLYLDTIINTSLPIECVVTNNKGYLVASLRPSVYWEHPIRTYSRSKGAFISSNRGYYNDIPILKYVPNTNNIVSITMSGTPADLALLQIDDYGVIDTMYNDRYHGDYILHPYLFEVSSNGEYFITGNEGAVYTANSSLTYKGMVDRGNLQFTDFAFSKDGNTIYAGVWNNKSLYTIKYPELTLGNETLLSGYPVYLFYQNGQIISLCNSAHVSNAFGIEKIKIE